MQEAQAYEEDGGHEASGREVVNRMLVADGSAADRNAAKAMQEDMSNAAIRDYLYDATTADVYAIFENSGFGMVDTPDNFGDGTVVTGDDRRADLQRWPSSQPGAGHSGHQSRRALAVP